MQLYLVNESDYDLDINQDIQNLLFLTKLQNTHCNVKVKTHFYKIMTTQQIFQYKMSDYLNIPPF